MRCQHSASELCSSCRILQNLGCTGEAACVSRVPRWAIAYCHLLSWVRGRSGITGPCAWAGSGGAFPPPVSDQYLEVDTQSRRPLTPSPKKRSVGALDPKCTYARSWGARSAATPCQRRRGGRDARSSAGDRWTIPTRSRRRGGGGDTRVVTSYISCANEANAPHEDLSENSESCDARMPEPTVDGSPPYAYGPRGSKLRGRARPTPPLLT